MLLAWGAGDSIRRRQAVLSLGGGWGQALRAQGKVQGGGSAAHLQGDDAEFPKDDSTSTECISPSTAPSTLETAALCPLSHLPAESGKEPWCAGPAAATHTSLCPPACPHTPKASTGTALCQISCSGSSFPQLLSLPAPRP